MKLLFKVVILFMIVFNWRMPYVYNSVFLAMAFTALYYIVTDGFIPFTYFSLRYCFTILAASFILSMIYLLITLIHGQYVDFYTKRILVEMSMFIALIFALPMFFDGEESDAFDLASKYICYAFALQGLIHLTGYLVPAFGEYMLSLKPEGLQAGFRDRQRNIDEFRGYALTGSLFFELPCGYGVAFIMFMRLKLKEIQNNIVMEYKWYLVLFFMFAGVMLSGRVGFIGIAVSLFFFFMFAGDPIGIISRNFRRILAVVIIFFGFYFLILSPSKRRSLNNEVFPFAFEWYYSWKETGRLGTGSSNATLNFYFPLEAETLMFGHGGEQVIGTKYPFTEAGYMRTLIFGGIPLLLILIFYQSLFFRLPINITQRFYSRESKIDRYCFWTLFAYIFIVHIKDSAIGVQHITETLFLFVCTSYLIQYYYWEEHEPTLIADSDDE